MNDADGLAGDRNGATPLVHPSVAIPPEPEWTGLPIATPSTLPASVPEIDFLDFVALGDGDDSEEWMVDGLVPFGGLTVLGGNPKTGKTLFALDLGFAVAAPRPFLGRTTTEAAFLYVTEEGAPAEMRKRARRLLASGVPVRPARLIYRRGIRFDDPRTWKLVTDALDRLAQPTLLVLDPLREMLGGDENDSGAIANVGRAIRSVLSDFPGVTVLLLHHLTKRGEGDGGQRLRGSSALWGAADCVLLFKAEPAASADQGEVALAGTVYVEPRNAPKAVSGWSWDPETGHFVSADAPGLSLADRAADLLAVEGPLDTPRLADRLGTTSHSLRTVLSRHHGRFRALPGEPGQPSLWQVVE